MSEKSLQRAANVAKVGLFVLWFIFMYSLVKNS